MAIKTIEYTVDIAGITPAAERFAGTQGDHRVTKLEFVLSDDLYDEITHATTNKVMLRFDVYDGEGGIWTSDATELSGNTVSIELEERHTRYGGKITVYLVMTALSEDNETEIELYSFPARLRLNNRPDGISQDGENYESMTALAESAKSSALAAETSNQELQGFAVEIEEKLKNGDFDGVGVKNAEIVNDELIITYTDNTVQNLGNVKGEKGDVGPQGEKGDTETIGEDKTVNGVGFISINENIFLADVKFTTNAPQNTEVRIYNENFVDENTLVGTVEEYDDYVNFTAEFINVDTQGGELSSNISNFGEFVFNKNIQTPSEYASYSHSCIRINSSGGSIYNIPVKDLEVGSTYTLIYIINTDTVVNGKETYSYVHTFDKIYLLNKTKSVVETVNADGSISTANIKPYTVAMLEDLTTSESYNFSLYYVVSDFVTKQYVDTIFGDIETALDGIIAMQETLIGGESE